MKVNAHTKTDTVKSFMHIQQHQQHHQVGQFPLALAAGRGHVEFVKWLVQFCAADVEETDLVGSTLHD